MQTHSMFDDRLQVYKRDNSRYWQCAARVGGRRFRQSTGEESLERAKDVAEDWYLGLRGQARNGEITPKEKTFGEAAAQYLREARVLASVSRSPRYITSIESRLNSRILPFLKDKPLSKVNGGVVNAYRVHRHELSMKLFKRAPARSTMLQEVVVIRQVLKTAEAHGWIPFVPRLSTQFLDQGKKGRRAWFSPEEYKQLYTATGRKASSPSVRHGYEKHYEDLHDLVLFLANTGLRPDEAMRLQLRDVAIEYDRDTKETLLVIDVRGKTGVGYCKSTAGAVYPFQRLLARRQLELEIAMAEKDELKALKWNAHLEARRRIEAALKDGTRAPRHKLDPTSRVFPRYDRAAFNAILKEEKLKHDRDNQPRTLYSLRHTYISMRLMEGANIHAIANNCRTSVKMIEEFYAAHIKDRLDASAINVRRGRAPSKKAKAAEIEGPKHFPEVLLDVRVA